MRDVSCLTYPPMMMHDLRFFSFRLAGVILLTSLLMSGCSKTVESTTTAACAPLEGTPWVPSVTGASASHHGAGVTVAQSTQSAIAPVIGLAQAAPAAKETDFTIPMLEDLGSQGSLSLIATVKNAPAGMTIYPLLVYLSDGTNDFVNLARAGTGGDCAASGYFTTSGTENSNCTVQWPSAYFDRYHWEQHWIQAMSGASAVDTFPTCNWTSGGGPSHGYGDPACPFVSNGSTLPDTGSARTGFLSSGKLVYGTNYHAKYVLIADGYASLSATTATLEVTAVKKTSSSASAAVDVNVVFVGAANVVSSRTAKGKLNLDLLFSNIDAVYAQAGVNLGAVRVIEWGCETGGDAYANLTTSDIYKMFEKGGASIPATASGVNLFFVTSFTDSASTLGIAGAIGGPFTAGTPLSGVAVATLGVLEKYNPSCTTATCPVTSQDADFRQLGPTVAHEMGHFLGLNHPSESPDSSGQIHDVVNDSPLCTHTNSAGNVSIYSCSTDTHVYQSTGSTCPAVCPSYDGRNDTGFCSDKYECQFNHLMFRTSKYYVTGTAQGDGNMISPDAAAIIKFHPLVQ